MRYLKLFHRDVLTVRSHQWKYYVEPYSGCALQCTYCLYWDSPAFVQRLQPPDDLLEAVDRDLAAMPRKQIIYIGATIDPYQMLEKKRQATRRLLERLVEREMPVVILTKSTLILRDLDLLIALNRKGLVMVQFTVLTTDSAVVGRRPVVREYEDRERLHRWRAGVLQNRSVAAHEKLGPRVGLNDATGPVPGCNCRASCSIGWFSLESNPTRRPESSALRPRGPGTIRHIERREDSKGFDGFQKRGTAFFKRSDRVGAIRPVLLVYEHLAPVFDDHVL